MTLTQEEILFAEEYNYITGDPDFQKLKDIQRHGSTNTYNHSIRVARAVSRMAEALNMDPERAAVVGLLHDFCLTDYRNKEQAAHQNGRWYCFYHPEEALDNASRLISLSKKEQKAILSHMFPLATHLPTSRLALILTLADKQVAAAESAQYAYLSCRRAGHRIRSSMRKAFK